MRRRVYWQAEFWGGLAENIFDAPLENCRVEGAVGVVSQSVLEAEKFGGQRQCSIRLFESIGGIFGLGFSVAKTGGGGSWKRGKTGESGLQPRHPPDPF
jgi:hypothetical protein